MGGAAPPPIALPSLPPRIFFCFSYFIPRKLRGEGRREFILNSTPLESSFVFCISLFEDQRSRDESVFVSRSREQGGWGGRSPPPIARQKSTELVYPPSWFPGVGEGASKGASGKFNLD